MRRCSREDRQGSIPLLITDIVMPQMSGRKLAEKLREIYPRLLVLYVSGWTVKPALHNVATRYGFGSGYVQVSNNAGGGATGARQSVKGSVQYDTFLPSAMRSPHVECL